MTAQLPDPSVGAPTDLQQRVADLERENARLRQDRAEGLARESATGEILRVIAGSPTDLQRVLEAIIESAARLCDAPGAALQTLRERDGCLVPQFNYGMMTTMLDQLTPEEVDRRLARVPTRGFVSGRAFLDRRTVRVDDLAEAVKAEFPESRERQRVVGHRSVVDVPLVRAGESIGVLSVMRFEVSPFTDREVALLETFADQAVIAIENARLFQELQDRTAELGELNRTLEGRVREQVDELERVGRLRRYLSPQLAELIVSSGDESILASHRRQITVVSCDLRGFTAFAETAEPEEVMGVLAEYHAAMGELIRQYEGTLDRFAGDGLMVFFNDPLPQPDHAERAVRMACAMRERAAGLALGWRREGHELGFGVGVAVGYATLGRIGFEGRFDYTAIGTVANLAARLCGEAAGGQIMIPARLHGMVETLVEAEPVGELALKGFHRPVTALNVTGLRAGESTDAGGTA